MGDFALAHPSYIRRVLDQLTGKIHLIWGSHDTTILKQKDLRDRFEWVLPLYDLKIDSYQITLCHYNMRRWNKSHHGTWHLYGHSHQKLDIRGELSFDVGCMGWNYYPISLEQVIQKMHEKQKAIENNKLATEHGVYT